MKGTNLFESIGGGGGSRALGHIWAEMHMTYPNTKLKLTVEYVCLKLK